MLRQQGEFELIVPTLAVWSRELNALTVSVFLVHFDLSNCDVCEITVHAYLGTAPRALQTAGEVVAMATRGRHNRIFRFHPRGRFDAYRRHATR